MHHDFSTEFNHGTQLDRPPKKAMSLKLELHKFYQNPSFSLTLCRCLWTEELLKNLLKRLTFTWHLAPRRAPRSGKQTTSRHKVINQKKKNSTSSLTTGPFKGETATWANVNQKIIPKLWFQMLQVGETSGITQKANRDDLQTQKTTSHRSAGFYLTKSNQRTTLPETNIAPENRPSQKDN